MSQKIGILVVWMSFLTTLVYAQNEPTQMVVLEQQEASSVAGSGQNENVSISEAGLVSLDFREADIKNILKILSFKSGVNIVAGPEVTGVVTIQLSDVPWKQALEVILQSYGYAYEQKGNIILVTTVEKLKKQREDAMVLAEQVPLETKTFTLNFAKASEIISSVEKMKSNRGSVDFDERTNTLIVTDTPDKMELMGIVVESLDTTTPQVLIEAKIVETTLSNTDKMGIDWVAKVTIGGAERPITWPFTRASSNKYMRGENFPGPDTTEGSSNTEFTYGTLNFTQVQAVFELLRSRSDTNILSNPRIVTMDNQPAKIVVGSQYPIPTYTYNEDQARLQVSGWEYKDIGIIFDVTPSVNKAGFVTLAIEPKITAILDFVTVESTSLPRLSNESALKVMIKDGETLVIGGLLKDQTTDTRKKTPILGDIPILGLVFQKKEKSVTKQDLLIFLTPHIITPEIPEDS